MAKLWNAIQRREIYFVILYFLIDGLTNPSFSDFGYFFMLNVIGLSKFMFAMITLVGSLCSMVGVVIYEAFLKEVEVRWLLFWSVIFSIIGGFFSYMLAMRWNLEIGISDLAFIYTTSVVFGALSTAFSTLPIMALFAKITPHRVEGTVFALLTGTLNLDQAVLQSLVGAYINNHFVGVTKDDQSGYPTLCLISLCCQPIGFILLFLIPLRRDIEWANRRRQMDKEYDMVLSLRRQRARDLKRRENKQNANM